MMRRAAALLVLLPLLLPDRAAVAGATYAIDQRFGEIAFQVRHLGLFSSHGTFRRFSGQLTIDEAHPENTRITVTIDTGSVAMDWAQAVAMLRGPAYFDVQRYPAARFASTRVVALAPDRYEIDGTLTLRGITRPVVLQAALIGRHPAEVPGVEIAAFVVTGQLRRSLFGMTADRVFVSDRVDLRIDARVRLEQGVHAG
jgi:polyisoprenoid-binding protein YceI